MGAAPAETVPADADAIAQRLAVALHQIEPPLGGFDDNGAGRIILGKVHAGARDRTGAGGPAAKIALAHDRAVFELGVRLAGAGQQCHRRKQQNKRPGHFLSS